MYFNLFIISLASTVKYDYFYGKGDDPIWMDDIVCTGEESMIFDCSHAGFGIHNCYHHEDVGVVCSGEKFLVYLVSQGKSWSLNASTSCCYIQITAITLYFFWMSSVNNSIKSDQGK